MCVFLVGDGDDTGQAVEEEADVLAVGGANKVAFAEEMRVAIVEGDGGEVESSYVSVCGCEITN